MEFYTCIAKYAFFGIRDEKLLASARKSWYHTMVCSGIEAVITGLTRNREISKTNPLKSQHNSICSGIEVVITALTRNQVYRQRYRGFESHPLRQKPCQQSAFRLLAFLFQFGAKPKPLSIASGEVRFAFH